MSNESGLAFSHTADYTYIDLALKARWGPFLALEQELHSFTPRKVEDFGAYRLAELARLKTLNPESPEEPR